MKNYLKKHSLVIVAYIVYASLVLMAIADERGYHFWKPFLGWLITVPFLVGGVQSVQALQKNSR